MSITETPDVISVLGQTKENLGVIVVSAAQYGYNTGERVNGCQNTIF